MSEQPIEYLRHILDECRFIISATSDHYSQLGKANYCCNR